MKQIAGILLFISPFITLISMANYQEYGTEGLILQMKVMIFMLIAIPIMILGLKLINE